jgi:hypothetical protein
MDFSEFKKQVKDDSAFVKKSAGNTGSSRKAQIVKMDFYDMILNSMILCMYIVSDEPLPDELTLNVTGGDVKLGILGRRIPTFEANGPHTVYKAKPSQMNDPSKVQVKLQDGRYQTIYMLTIGHKEFIRDIKTGTHEVILFINGDMIDKEFTFHKQYKAGASKVEW